MAFYMSTIIPAPKSPHIRLLHTNPISLHLFPSPSPPILSFPLFCPIIPPPPPLFALKSGRTSNTNTNTNSGSGYDAYGAELLRKPVSSAEGGGGYGEEAEGRRRSEEEEEEAWVDWEDQILEDTVPLVGFVRMILHSGKYESGDRLSPEHEKTILERLLPYHPECEKKIGSGVDYIKVGYHPDFESSRCLFIVRTDGQLVDFSYWKCLKGLIKKNYPLYADSFILRHFRRRRRSE